MQVLSCFLLSAFMFIQIAFAQQSDLNNLIGKWKFADNYECPDILEFNLNGSYTIFNDCGSIDPKLPIIENGSWKFKSEENEIILFKREFVSPNSVFSEYHGKNDSLSFKINELTDKRLTLCFIKDIYSDCIIENYIRIQ